MVGQGNHISGNWTDSICTLYDFAAFKHWAHCVGKLTCPSHQSLTAFSPLLWGLLSLSSSNGWHLQGSAFISLGWWCIEYIRPSSELQTHICHWNACWAKGERKSKVTGRSARTKQILASLQLGSISNISPVAPAEVESRLCPPWLLMCAPSTGSFGAIIVSLAEALEA